MPFTKQQIKNVLKSLPDGVLETVAENLDVEVTEREATIEAAAIKGEEKSAQSVIQ